MGNPTKLLRLPEVISRTGYKKSTIYEMIGDGRFPSPVNLGPRAIAWVEEEIEKWIKARISERDKKLTTSENMNLESHYE